MTVRSPLISELMNYTESSYFFDLDSKSIQDLIEPYRQADLSDKDRAIALYERVRDGWKYNPYHISLSPDNYIASNLVNRESGNCVEKSIILIAALRGLGIPARLHLGKVKNHIAVERLTEKFGSNELSPHGMVNIYLDGKWLKCSPAFNKTLCEKLHVEPLEFDGQNNSFLQAFNSDGNQFMEYTDDYGFFDDVPLDFMIAKLVEHYPHIFNSGSEQVEYQL